MNLSSSFKKKSISAKATKINTNLKEYYGTEYRLWDMDSGEAPWERPSSQPYFVQHLTHDSSHAVRQRTPTTGSLTVYQVQERFAALP